MRNSFVYYESFRDAMRDLPDDTQLRLYNAIADYALYDAETDFEGDVVALAVFKLIKPQLDANIRKRENGTRGGRPSNSETEEEPNNNKGNTKSEPTHNQDQTQTEPNANANANANGNGNGNGNKTPLPPLDEFSEPIQAAIKNWLSYKDERREKYKPTGLTQFISMTRNAVSKYGEDAVLYAFTQSMGANYQGVVWEKAQKFKAEPPDNYYERLN